MFHHEKWLVKWLSHSWRFFQHVVRMVAVFDNDCFYPSRKWRWYGRKTDSSQEQTDVLCLFMFITILVSIRLGSKFPLKLKDFILSFLFYYHLILRKLKISGISSMPKEFSIKIVCFSAVANQRNPHVFVTCPGHVHEKAREKNGFARA